MVQNTPMVLMVQNEPDKEIGKRNAVYRNIIKKTIKKNYILGRSKTHNRVGILIKDRDTRKKIIQAQKDLKRKPIHDIKLYLRDHGLIKVGTNAPNDVLRKIYESSIMTGEVQNYNKDILFHNFMKEKEKEKEKENEYSS